MKSQITVGLVGDFAAEEKAHVAIPKALALAANVIGCPVAICWLPTPGLERNAGQQLAGFDAIWCVPASPYVSMEGALNAIQFARERPSPFLGTCGGFQHAVIEYARNVLGLREADHAESNPGASLALVARLACSLAGATEAIDLRPGTQARTLYGQSQIVEQFNCNFGVNPKYQAALEDTKLKVSGVDAGGGVRIIELTGHPFFIATLFQPELSAFAGIAHPLVVAFARAALL